MANKTNQKICTRSLDELGRIVLPAHVRKELDLEGGDPIDIFFDGNTIVLKKFEPCCFVCKADGPELKRVRDKFICAACAALIEP